MDVDVGTVRGCADVGGVAGVVGAMVGVGGSVTASAQDITTRIPATREMQTTTRLFRGSLDTSICSFYNLNKWSG